MAERSGFFPYVAGDANSEYDSAWLAKYIASIIGNGVYDGELAVTAGDGMAVTLPAGRAWINGYHYRNDGPLTLPVDNADGVLHRKDTVVLRWDVNARSITAQVLKGAPASTATAPEITRSMEQYDLKLAEISIPAGTTAIKQSLITDTRLDNKVCGIVTGVVKQVDTTTFYNQIADDLARFRTTNEADFNAWVQSIKGILGEDEAGNLLNLINDLAGSGRTTETVKGNADNIAALQSGKADKSAVVTTTLPASAWAGTDAPYSQTISVDGVTATSANEILPGASISASQLELLQLANLQDGGQAAGSITVLAYGGKPTADLPIRVIVRGDL
jgi:hypothetical protein